MNYSILIKLFSDFCKSHNFIPITPLSDKDGVYMKFAEINSTNDVEITIVEQKDKTDKGINIKKWYIGLIDNKFYCSREKDYTFYRM